MLTLGWSDGHTFLPIDFSLLSSPKTKINGISEQLDKRSVGYKRRLEALKSAPEMVLSMIDHALYSGVTASYVLMDSWFTQPPLIQALVQKGLNVIGMLKSSKQKYRLHDQLLSLKELYFAATPIQGRNKNIIRSVHVQLPSGIPVKIVFVRHRSKKKEWLAILSTDCSLCVKKSSAPMGSVGILKCFLSAPNLFLNSRRSSKAVPMICLLATQPLFSLATSYSRGSTENKMTTALLVGCS